ncbi:MAG: hypothetical protein U1E83_09750 [Methylotetracoccus sp.]
MKKKGAFICTGLLLIGACSEQSADNALTERRVALCKDVMKAYIKEAKIYERDRDRLIGSCGISQKERTVDQWQCVLAAVQGGQKYAEASQACGSSRSVPVP